MDREPAPHDDQHEGDAEQPLGRDERVSGWPASFEDVVRALAAMPRVARKRKPPKGD